MKTHIKNQWFVQLTTIGTAVLLAAVQLALIPIAHAQSSDPGQQPDPIPHVEATPGPTFSISFIESEVAAGGVNALHQARFKITATDSNDKPAPNLAVPSVQDVSANKGANNTSDASFSLDSATTDSNGEVYGTLTSGNRLDTTTLSINSFPDNPGNNPQASISQVVNTTGSGWDYPDTFEIGETVEISYSLAYSRGAITGHNLQFRATSIAGWEWFDDIGDDWDGDGVPDGDYEEVAYDEEDAEFGDWSSLIAIVNKAEVAGKYSADMTVNDDSNADFFVTEAGFGFSDYTVREQ